MGGFRASFARNGRQHCLLKLSQAWALPWWEGLRGLCDKPVSGNLGQDRGSWAMKHHRVELWLTKADKHLHQHASHMDVLQRKFITAPKPNPHFAVFPTTTPQLSTAPVGHWDALHQPDPLWVTQTPNLKWAPGSGATWHTQGQVQPSSKGDSGCFAAAIMPICLPAATGHRKELQWVSAALDTPHTRQSLLQGSEPCVQPQKDKPWVSSPCTVSF